jgi:imidazolonepropionase-like amidohydrolase
MRLRGLSGILLAFIIEGSIKAQSAIAFTNVAVVDVEKGALRFDQTVVIEGSRITVAGDAQRIRPPRGARVIDGEGKFLMPGLWDMHVHAMPKPHVPELFIANGVTGIRDMYDDPPKIRELRKAIREHRRIGPRVVTSGKIVNGALVKNRNPAPLTLVHTPEEARRAVSLQIKEGVDFIKIYDGLSRNAYYAIADECKRDGIPFVGHTPASVTTAEAAAAGQRSIEHLSGVLLDCSSHPTLIRWLPDLTRLHDTQQRTLDWFDPVHAQALFATFVRYGTWQCPTLSVFKGIVLDDDPSLADTRRDPNLRYLNLPPLPRSGKPSQLGQDRAIEQQSMAVTAMMFRAGVRLLAGTDRGLVEGDPFFVAGFALHDEIELMVSAGLPVSAVLRIATLAPAQFFRRENELGSVSDGKLADLVLLDADPLQSISNTRLIRAVVADGRLYDRAALDGLLRDAGSSSAAR